FAFGANASTAVFLEPGSTTVSDVVVLSDVNGVANISFASDLDAPGLVVPAPPFVTVVEPNAFVAVAASTTAGASGGLTFTFSSDVNESLTSSDTVTIGSPVPEPATYFLIGIALVTLSAVRSRCKSRASKQA